MKNGWQTKPLGELCRFIDYRGKTPEKTTSGLRLITAKNVKMGYLQETPAEFVAPESYETWMTRGIPKMGDVLFTTEAPLANVAQLDTDEQVVFAQRIIVLQPAASTLDPTFLKYHLLSDVAQDRILEHGTGATVKGIKASLLKLIPIPLPALAEQQRIVTLLDEAFEGIATAKANAEKNLQNARALFESHLQSVFTQRGTCWVHKRLGDVVTRLTNGFVGPTRNIYQESGVPYLLARHVKNNRLQFDGKTFISDEFNRKNKKSILKAGDVLLVQSGHIGHSAVVTKDHEGHNCHAMIVITPVEGAFIGPFLSLFFNTSGMKQKFQEIRSGSTVPHLTCGEVRELMIPLPDIAEQRRIVRHAAYISAATHHLSTIYQRKLSALEELKRSLFHQAFSGRL